MVNANVKEMIVRSRTGWVPRHVGHMKNAAKNAAHTTTWMDHHTVFAVGHQDMAP